MKLEAVGSYNRRFFPTEMDSMPIHPSNAFFTIFSKLSGRYKLCRAEQLRNELSPMRVIPSGNITSLSDVQSLKE